VIRSAASIASPNERDVPLPRCTLSVILSTHHRHAPPTHIVSRWRTPRSACLAKSFGMVAYSSTGNLITKQN